MWIESEWGRMEGAGGELQHAILCGLKVDGIGWEGRGSLTCNIYCVN